MRKYKDIHIRTTLKVKRLYHYKKEKTIILKYKINKTNNTKNNK